MTVAERFWAKVRKSDGCWEWIAAKRLGYGRLAYEGRLIDAHRLSWLMHNGPIPDGLCVLHRCDNRPCVRPNHLFLGTKAENLEDMTRKGRRSHWRPPPPAACKRGHAFDEANTYLYLSKQGWRMHVCRACARAYQARRRERLKAA